MQEELEIEVTEEVEEESSLHDDLSAAFEEADGDVSDIPAEESIFAETEPVAETAPAVDAPADGAVPEETPPVGLSAAAREHWKDTPKAVRDEVAKRERDYATGMQRHAEGAKRAAGMDTVIGPHSQYIQMNGGPGKAVGDLLMAGSTLQMGSPLQKAQQVAGLIQQFGVDISTLDGLLSGQGVPRETQQRNDVQRQVQEAVAPYQQQAQQFQRQQQQQTLQAQHMIGSEIQQFAQDPQNEFYRDVRMEMADILEMASNRGVELGLQEAYQRACAMRPDVAAILNTRASAPTAGKRRAASSIHGTPGGSPAAGAPGSMREAIEAAFDQVGRV
jgi:hypothetical protein